MHYLLSWFLVRNIFFKLIWLVIVNRSNHKFMNRAAEFLLVPREPWFSCGSSMPVHELTAIVIVPSPWIGRYWVAIRYLLSGPYISDTYVKVLHVVCSGSAIDIVVSFAVQKSIAMTEALAWLPEEK